MSEFRRRHLLLVALGAILLAVGSYVMAWVAYQNQKSKQPDQHVEVTMPAAGLSYVSQTTVIPEIHETEIQPSELVQDIPRYFLNAEPVSVPQGAPRIAVVIDDVGVVPDQSARAVAELPKEMTLSFLPYGESTPALSLAARKKRHEVMIHLPMEPLPRDEHVVDPGPNALFVKDNMSSIKDKIAINFKSLAQIAVGVNNHMGSRFTTWAPGMEQTMREVAANQMMYMDSLTSADSVAASTHKKLEEEGITFPLLTRDVFIDHYDDTNHINAALNKLERIAQSKGYAIGIGHPHKTTIDALVKWAPTLQKKGIYLVPITNVLNK